MPSTALVSFKLLVVFSLLINLNPMPVAPTTALPGAVGAAAHKTPARSEPSTFDVWLGLAHDALLNEAHDVPFDAAHDVTVTSDAAWHTATLTLGDLTIANGATLTLAGPSRTRLTADDLRVAAGGRLVVSGMAIVTATNVTVESGATVSADGLGYGASAGPGAGADGTGPFQQAGGGGHGGRGGEGRRGRLYVVYLPLAMGSGSGTSIRAAGASYVGGQPYDDAAEPRMMGSGGGSTASAPGGAGGGALRLVVDDTLIMNGDLSANGLAGVSSDAHAGGGGAGGSIWIETIAFAGNGTVRANGGDGGGTQFSDTYGQGGGGAGGRVAIHASGNVFTSTGGTISVVGGSGYEDGGAGTIFVSDAAKRPASLTADLVAPKSALPGDKITYTLWVTNAGDETASGVTVADTLPDQVDWITTVGATYLSETHQVRWEPGAIGAGEAVSLTLQGWVRLWALAGPVVNRVTLEAPGVALSDAVTTTVQAASSMTATITPAEGGRLEDGELSLLFPSEAVSQTTVVTLTTSPRKPLVSDQPGMALSFHLEPDMPLATPVTLTLALTDLLSFQDLEEGFRPYLAHLSDAEWGEWTFLPLYDVNWQTGVATAVLEHFSSYGTGVISENGWQLTFNEPGVSLFRGSMSYAYPLALPAGRGGLGPQLALSYNSDRVDGIFSHVQSDWVGLGWSLDAPQITRKVHWCPWQDPDNGHVQLCAESSYTLLINGASYELVSDRENPSRHPNSEVGRFDTEEASFYDIEKLSTEQNELGTYWIVKTQDGTEYRFGLNGDAEQVLGDVAYLGRTVYRWRLDSIVDVWGNEVLFTYHEEENDPYHRQRASYLSEIQYNFNDPSTGSGQAGSLGTRIVLDRAGRGEDGDENECDRCMFFQEEYLDGVRILQEGRLVREYDLAYAFDGDVRLLQEVTEYGGGEALPATSFEYESFDNRRPEWGRSLYPHSRLVAVENGYGGRAEVDYQGQWLNERHGFHYRMQEKYTLNGLEDAGRAYSSRRAYSYGPPCWDSGDSACSDGHAAWGLTGYEWAAESAYDYAGSPLSQITSTFVLTWPLTGRVGVQEAADPSSGETLARTETAWAYTWLITPTRNEKGVAFVFSQGVTETAFSGGVTVSQRTEYEYDEEYGNVVEVREYASAGDATPYRSSSTDYVANPTAWIVKPWRVQTFEGDSQGDALSKVKFFYDRDENGAVRDWLDQPLRGALVREDVVGMDTDPRRHVKSDYWYDGYGNVVTQTNALTQTATTVYDDVYHTFPITVCAAVETGVEQCSHTEYYGVNGPGMEAEGAAFGAVARAWGPNGASTATAYRYDAFGRVLTATLPGDDWDLPSTVYRYDDSYTAPGGQRLMRVTAWQREQSGRQGQVLKAAAIYDGLGRTLQSRAEAAGGQTVVSAVEYDALGRATPYHPYFDDNGSYHYVPVPTDILTTETHYDALGRPVRVDYADGTHSTTSYVGRTTTVTDANGHRRAYTYDALGQLIRVQEYTGSAPAEVYATTVYTYDVRGDLVGVEDTLGHTTVITYDDLGRKMAMDDPDMGRWEYGYDLLGNLVTQTDALGQEITFDYDELNRLVGKSGNGEALARYSHDDGVYGNGQRTRMTYPGGWAAYDYDERGQLVEETRTFTLTSGPLTYTVGYAYDALGRVTALTYPDGEVVSQTYDAGGMPFSLGGDSAYVRAAAYNEAAQLSALVLGNGLTTTYSYDPLNWRLTNLRTAPATGDSLQDLGYGYDDVGNVLHIADATLGETQSFDYDSLDRLTSAEAAGGSAPYTRTYAYDPTGNLMRKGGITYTYAASDHMHAVTHLSDGSHFEYDANGNMTRRVIVSGTETITYEQAFDVENRLMAVTDTVRGKVTRFVYDGDGVRVAQIAPDGGATLYVGELYEERFPAGTITLTQMALPQQEASAPHALAAAPENDALAARRSGGLALYMPPAHGSYSPLAAIYGYTDPFTTLDADYWTRLEKHDVTFEAVGGAVQARRDAQRETSWAMSSIDLHPQVRFDGSGASVEWRFRTNPDARHSVVKAMVHDREAQRQAILECSVGDAGDYACGAFFQTPSNTRFAECNVTLQGYRVYHTFRIENPDAYRIDYYVDDDFVCTQTIGDEDWNNFDQGTVRWAVGGVHTSYDDPDDESVIDADLDDVTMSDVQDDASPTLTWSGQASGAWYADPTNPITVTAKDGETGVQCLDLAWGDPVTACSGYAPGPETTFAPREGVHTLHAYAQDWADNSVRGSRTYRLDASPPPIPTMNAEPAYTAGTANTVSWGAVNDGGVGGVEYMAQRAANSSFTVNVLDSGWQAGTSYTFDNLNHCQTYYYRVRSRDGLGHASGWSAYVSFTQDAFPPESGSVAINSGGGWTDSRDVTLSLSTSDTCVSASQLEMRFHNEGSGWSAWEPYATSRSWQLSSGDGAKTVYVQVRDPAGNASSPPAYDGINLDTSAPEITSFLIDDGDAWTDSRTVTLALDAEDSGGSGVSEMRFSDDGANWSEWESYVATRTYTLPDGDGSKTVYAQVRDVADNLSDSSSDAIQLDSAEPAISNFSVTPQRFSPPVAGQAQITAVISDVSPVTWEVSVDTSPPWTSTGCGTTVNTIWDGANGVGDPPTQYWVTLDVTDAAGQTSTRDDVWVVLDTQPPTLALSLPDNGTRTNQGSVEVRGTTSEGSDTVTVNGELLSPALNPYSQWEFLTFVSLSPGVNIIDVTSQDLAGNEASQTRTVIQDTRGPVVDGWGPVGVSAENQPLVWATFAPSEGGSAVVSSQTVITLDDARLSAGALITPGGFRCTPTATLAQGMHSVRVTIEDEAGNAGGQAWLFEVDTLTWVRVDSPSDGAVLNQVTTDVLGSAEEGDSVTLSVDGVPTGTAALVGATGTFTFTGVTLSDESDNLLTAEASDDLGNQDSYTVMVNVNTGGPAAEVDVSPAVFSPDGDGYQDEATFSLHADGPEAGGVANWSLRIADGVDQTIRVTSGDGPPPQLWEWDGQDAGSTVVDDGDYFYRLAVTATNQTTATTAPKAVTVDTAAPAAPVITSPDDDTRTRETGIVVRGAAEPGSKVTVLNGGTFTRTADVDEAGDWQLLFVLESGPNALTALATDAAGHESPPSEPVNVQVVVGEPLVEVGLEPILANGNSTLRLWATAWGSEHISGTTQMVTATLPGQGGQIEIVLLHQQSLSENLGLWEMTWDVTSETPDGPNEVLYRGQDDTGYVGEPSPQGLWVDRAPPAAPIIHSPGKHTTTDQDSVSVQGTAGANETLLLFVDDVLTGTTEVQANGWWEVEVELAEGDNEVFVRARDLAGNESADSASITVSRDTQPPQISGDVSPDVTRPGQAVVLSADVSDAGDVGRVTVEIEGVGDYDLGQGTGSHEYTVTLPGDLGEGEKQVTFSAHDRVGNVGTCITTLLVDDTPPGIAVTGISESSPYAYASGATMHYGPGEGSFTVQAQADDGLAGLETLTFAHATSPGATYPQSGATHADESHTYTFDANDTFGGTPEVAATDHAGNEGMATFTVIRDGDAPQVSVEAIPTDDHIDVTWNATDSGSGVAGYDLQVRVDAGEWETLLSDSQDTSYAYLADYAHSYTFRVTATDNVGNVGQGEARTTTANAVTKYYYFGGRRVAMRGPDGAVNWLHGDHLGSTSLATDGAGDEVSRQLYYPFGERRWVSAELPTDFGFTGQRNASTIGLYDYHARFYDPALGRFIQADTIVPEPGTPQNLNRYAYVKNNPLVYVDPSGNTPTSLPQPTPAPGLPTPVGTPTPDQILAFWHDAQLDPQILRLVQAFASDYGVPWQIVAGVLTSEIELDTDFGDKAEDFFWRNFGYDLGDLYLRHFRENPGPGIGNVHVLTAQRVSEYFRDNYSDDWHMQLGWWYTSRKGVASGLVFDYSNIKTVAAYVRMLADYRFGSDGEPLQTDHSDLSKWSVTDAAAVWHGYRYGVPRVSPEGQGLGFEDLKYFQDRGYSWSEGIRRSIFIGDYAEESVRGAIPFLQCYLSGCG